MKIYKFGFSFLVTLVIMSLMVSVVSAASTTKSLSTNFTLVNLGSLNATVQVEYILANGAAWPNVLDQNKSFTLDKDGGQIQIRQYTDTMDSGSGSAVVSSDQPLGAVVQIQARNQVATTGAYKGYNQGSDLFYAPLVARRGVSVSGTANSQIIIQNSGNADVAFKVEFKPAPGFTGSYTKTVPSLAKGVSYYYDVEEETNLPSGWFGSAVVTATTPGGLISVVVNLFFGTDGLQTYNAFPKEDIGNTWLVPIFTSRLSNGLSTVVTVQNLTGASLVANAIQLNCKQDGTLTPLNLTNPNAVEDKASYSFNPVTNLAIPDSWFGSCIVSSPGNDLAVYVQMRYVGVPGVSNVAAYEAVNGNGTFTSVFVPLIAKRLGNGFATVVNISNLSSQNNTVDLVYTPSPIECPVNLCDKSGNSSVGPEDAITIAGVVIPGNGGIQRSHRTGEPDLPNGWIGSLKVTSTSSLPIGGIVQLTNVNLLAGDTLMAHGAFGK